MLNTDVSFGTLRSELDEPSILPASFEELVRRATQAKAEYNAHSISKVDYAGLLSKLVISAPDGTEWTIGASSGQWFRRFPDSNWIPTIPPSAEDVGTSWGTLPQVQHAGWGTTAFTPTTETTQPEPGIEPVEPDFELSSEDEPELLPTTSFLGSETGLNPDPGNQPPPTQSDAEVLDDPFEQWLAQNS